MGGGRRQGGRERGSQQVSSNIMQQYNTGHGAAATYPSSLY